jgi:hypothetical protein
MRMRACARRSSMQPHAREPGSAAAVVALRTRFLIDTSAPASPHLFSRCLASHTEWELQLLKYRHSCGLRLVVFDQ